MCMVTASRLEPSLSFQETALKYNNPPADDPSFPKTFDRAKNHLVAEQQKAAEDPSRLPVWVPTSQCSRQDNYGHELYVKAGALTESEVMGLFKKSPQQLKLEPWTGHLKSPKESTKYFLVSLCDMPQATRDRCRKVKIFWQSGCVLDELWLHPNLQLAKNQGQSVFNYINEEKYNSRPPKVLTQTLPTVPELEQQALRLSNLMEQVAEASQVDEESDDETQTKGPAQSAGMQALLEGMGDGMEAAAPAPKKKRRTHTAPSAPALSAGTAAAMSQAQALAAKAPVPIADGDTSSKKASRKESVQDEIIASLDSDLQRVARVHLTTPKGSSVNSL